MDVGLYVLSVLLVLAGLAGAILPALPGIPILFGGLWLAAWVDGYQHVGGGWLAVIAVVGALALLVDFLAGVIGAKRVGAQPAALWGSALGTVIGLFFGLPGLIFGPFLGALAGELCSGSSVLRSAHVGVSTWVGLLLGTLTKIIASFVMLGIFGGAWLF
ncbi:DUF456 domain-containing protein [Oleiagrimonas sp. C23AA]|uniref:DUF456 domain-containing protein n=1 Tax=Oleiagrimonas sp. C23AA TaxID=2719047 RepID=UPI001420774C|nr:DUF456 domain-containing protein [Oleiagrimonas sp. C23AA]NII11886.1 DUF456 domain-containing protein [Oleiagrimonas sp. C23AA]